MRLATHNSWTFLSPTKWWMRLIAFTARCQRYSIQDQYLLDSRFFDLRVKFTNGKFILAHGVIKYDYTYEELMSDLMWLNLKAGQEKESIYIRVVHEIRHEREINVSELMKFRFFCTTIEESFPLINFCNGLNLLPRKSDNIEVYRDYQFRCPEPSCEELYASVQPPKILDDWCPWLYAKLHNHKNIQKGTDKDFLMIDYVDIQ